jgi:hypothetical protein
MGAHPMKSFSYLIGSLAGTRLGSRSPFVTALIIALTARRFHRGAPRPRHTRRRVFFLPKTLFKEDLLNVFRPDDAEFELWYIAREPLRRLANAYLPGGLSEYDYRSADDATALRKDALRQHWTDTLKILKSLIRPSAFLTCAYYYREEREFAAASLSNKIPFIALHKECITTPVTRVARQEVYRLSGRFTGSRITTYNEDEKATIVAAGCADASIVDVVGCPRMDDAFKGPRVATTRAFDVVFFSFSISTYLPVYRKVPRWPAAVDGVPLSQWNWSELYQRYHAAAVRFAAAHPTLKVALKVKTGFDVADVLGPDALGRPLPDNLEIITSGEGGSLAAAANVIAGFNSTVLLEALAAKTPVIVPAFAEAEVGSTAERLGTLRLNGAVSYARSEDELHELLAAKAAHTPDRSRLFTADERQALERYIGFFDGQSGTRMRRSIGTAIDAPGSSAIHAPQVVEHRAGSPL